MARYLRQRDEDQELGFYGERGNRENVQLHVSGNRLMFRAISGTGLLTATLTVGSTPWATLASNTYDGRAADHPISPLPPGSFTPPTLHDTANYGASVTIRGNPTQIVTPDSNTSLWYDYTGTPRSITENGVTRAVETNSGSSYAVPTKIAANGYATNMSWNSLLQMTGQTGANGETMGFSYDGSGQFLESTSPYGGGGAVTRANPYCRRAAVVDLENRNQMDKGLRRWFWASGEE